MTTCANCTLTFSLPKINLASMHRNIFSSFSSFWYESTRMKNKAWVRESKKALFFSSSFHIRILLLSWSHLNVFVWWGKKLFHWEKMYLYVKLWINKFWFFRVYFCECIFWRRIYFLLSLIHFLKLAPKEFWSSKNVNLKWD